MENKSELKTQFWQTIHMLRCNSEYGDAVFEIAQKYVGIRLEKDFDPDQPQPSQSLPPKEDGQKPDLMMRVHSQCQCSTINGCPKEIPMGLLNEEWAQRNHSQSLTRLNERGGITLDEALSIINRRPFQKHPIPEKLVSIILHMITGYNAAREAHVLPLLSQIDELKEDVDWYKMAYENNLAANKQFGVEIESLKSENEELGGKIEDLKAELKNEIEQAEAVDYRVEDHNTVTKERNDLMESLTTLKNFLHVEITERRDYSASKAFEIVLEKIESLLNPEKKNES